MEGLSRKSINLTIVKHQSGTLWAKAEEDLKIRLIREKRMV